jgi:hypothetical protein
MKASRSVTVLCATLLPFAVAILANGGCKKDETETAPTASAPPAPTPTPPPAATVVPEEDAGLDAAADADADAKKVVGVSNVTKCCNAIRQNAKSAPPDQQLLYGAAIAVCNSGQIPPQFRNLPQCK